MNGDPYNSYIPPDLDYLREEDINGAYQRKLRRLAREKKQRLARLKREEMARKEAEVSSDSDVDTLTKTVKTAMELTPANSTPQELVKVDPAEIGMSVGYKHL